MKLLFSSLLLPLAAAQQQRGLGKLEEPNDATTLLNRWNMDVPKIQYEDSTDIFTFTFESASSDNYNQGLAESFWNPDCMPATSGSTGYPLPVALIHDSVDETKPPELVMDTVSNKPVMKFKINQAAFADSTIPDIYTGDALSCATAGATYGLVAKNMKCPVDSNYRLWKLPDVADIANADPSELYTSDSCYEKCKDDADCDMFTVTTLGWCVGCRGTMADLIPKDLGDTATAQLTYEMCDPPDYIAIDYVPVSGTIAEAKGSCTDASRVVTFGKQPIPADSGKCVGTSVGRGSTNGPVSFSKCYEMCYFDTNCDGFTYHHGALGTGDGSGGCMKCDSVNSLASPGPNNNNYETVAMCDRIPAPLVNPISQVDFCVRSSVGYTPDGAVAGTANLATPNPITGTTTDSNYQEVNFIETLVRIEYDMSSGFTVNEFSVAPKNRELTTISESYEDALIAYLCDTSLGVDTYTFDQQESYPKASSTADPFNQGALITVCVMVKEEFASQNIVLKELTDFSWSRSGGTTYNGAIGGVGDDLDTITQVAITGSEAAGNYLTSYDKTDCVNNYWCQFASVLFAQFYNTPGEVTGTGDAILQFKTTRNRRLGEGVDERSLQGDPGSAGMDISIDVNGVAEGPGDLKTASGPSFGATTVSVSVVTALVGAILLA